MKSQMIISPSFSFWYNLLLAAIFVITIIIYLKRNYELHLFARSLIAKLNDVTKPNKDEVIQESEQLINRFTVGKIADSLPGILVICGIVGTFLGLTAVLGTIEVSNEIEGLQNGIDQLLEGMIVSFSSTILGITLSIIWIIVDKMLIHPRTSQLVMELENILDDLSSRAEEQMLFENLLKVQRENTESFKTLASDNIIPELMDEFSKVLTNTLVPHMQKQTEMINKVVNSTTDGNQQMVSQFEEYTKAFNQLKKTIQTISNKKQQKELTNVIAEFTEYVKQLNNFSAAEVAAGDSGEATNDKE